MYLISLVSFRTSLSAEAVTVTVCAVLQFVGLNERLYGYVRTPFRSISASERPRPTVVVPEGGSESRTTVNVAPAASCSVTVRTVGVKVTPAVSSSVVLTPTLALGTATGLR